MNNSRLDWGRTDAVSLFWAAQKSGVSVVFGFPWEEEWLIVVLPGLCQACFQQWDEAAVSTVPCASFTIS